MDDKIIMNTALTLTKNACEIMLHGAIEASDKTVKTTFIDSLSDFINMQGSLFSAMESGGLYNIEDVPASKLKSSCKKFESSI